MTELSQLFHPFDPGEESADQCTGKVCVWVRAECASVTGNESLCCRGRWDCVFQVGDRLTRVLCVDAPVKQVRSLNLCESAIIISLLRLKFSVEIPERLQFF